MPENNRVTRTKSWHCVFLETADKYDRNVLTAQLVATEKKTRVYCQKNIIASVKVVKNSSLHQDKIHQPNSATYVRNVDH